MNKLISERMDEIVAQSMDEDLKGFVAGWFGGCVGLLASHPVDTVRVRIVTQGSVAGVKRRYSSSLQCFVDILKTEKVKGLYKGMTYPLIGQAAINATVFGVQHMVYRRLQDSSKPRNAMNSLIAGCTAGAIQSIIVCPVELIKIRMQIQGVGKEHVSWINKKMGTVPSGVKYGGQLLETYHGPWKTTRIILKEESITGLFRGWWLTIFREVPQFGIYFCTFDLIQGGIANFTGRSPDNLTVAQNSLAGGVTGVVTWCWYPVDVIKSRFQSDGDIDHPKKYKGIIHCFSQSVKEDGWKVLWRGIKPTLLRGFLNGVATFPVVVAIKRNWPQSEV